MFLDFVFNDIDRKTFITLKSQPNIIYYGEVTVKYRDDTIEKLDPEDPDLAEKLKKSTNKLRHGYGGYYILNDQNHIIETYQGQWFEDKMNGLFEIRYQNGSKYNGRILFARKNGYGKFIWPDGKNYQGFWKDDKMNGTGIYTDSKKSFEGSFINNYYLQPNNELVSPFMVDRVIDTNPRAKFYLEKTKQNNMYIRNYRFEVHNNYENLYEFVKTCFDNDMICLMSTFRNINPHLKDICNDISKICSLCYVDLKKLQFLKENNEQEYFNYHKTVLASLSNVIKTKGIVLVNVDEKSHIYKDIKIDIPKICLNDPYINYLFNPVEFKTAIKLRKSFDFSDISIANLEIGVLVYSGFKCDTNKPLGFCETKIKDRFKHDCDLKRCSVVILE